MSLKIAILTFLLLFQSQEKINVSSSVSKNSMNIGDKLTYKISIEYNTDMQIETPGEGINLGYFEIKDYIIHPPKLVGLKTIEEFEYTISTYDTGAFIIPPFPVAYFETKDRSDFNVVEAPEQRIYVKSIFLNDSTVKIQPKSIKNVLDVPYTSTWWMYLLGGIFIAGLIYYFFFHNKNGEEKIIPEIILLPHEKAFNRLNTLKGFDSSDQKEINNYYTELSMILRTYLEDRFQIPAVEETTFELQESLKSISITSQKYEELIRLVQTADLVKFAKEIPQLEDFNKIFNDIYMFVEETISLAEQESVAE